MGGEFPSFHGWLTTLRGLIILLEPQRGGGRRKGYLMKNMGRRDFIKGASLGALGLVGAGSLTACASAQESTTLAASGASNDLPRGLQAEDFKSSVVEIEPVTEFGDEKTYDIVVVGAGTSGIPAAITAFEEGASVAVLQKEATSISQGDMSSGIVLDESTNLGLQGFKQTYRKICNYRINHDLLDTFINYSGETALWLLKHSKMAGYEGQIQEFSRNDYYDGESVGLAVNTYGIKPKGHHDMFLALSEWAAAQGIEFFYETPAVQLVVEDGKVTGVVGKGKDGSYTRFNATKAVILATGDYQNNQTLVEKWSPDLTRFAKKQMNKTGDGILMAIMAGGRISPVGHSRQMHDFDAGPMFDEPFLAVDEEGNRFMNEQIEMTSWVCTLADRNKAEDPGKFCHIFDSNYAKYVTDWGGHPVSDDRIHDFVPGEKENATAIRADLIDTHYADTLEELAEQLGIPAPNLKASVERYNELCKQGKDEDFGKEAKYMKPIDQPPYWGIHRWIRVTATCNGVMVDKNYQVIDESDRPIPGLYSVGFGAGNLCGNVDWTTYLLGMSCGSCMTSGRVAALHAVKGVIEPSNPVSWSEMKDGYTEVDWIEG